MIKIGPVVYACISERDKFVFGGVDNQTNRHLKGGHSRSVHYVAFPHLAFPYLAFPYLAFRD